MARAGQETPPTWTSVQLGSVRMQQASKLQTDKSSLSTPVSAQRAVPSMLRAVTPAAREATTSKKHKQRAVTVQWQTPIPGSKSTNSCSLTAGIRRSSSEVAPAKTSAASAQCKAAADASEHAAHAASSQQHGHAQVVPFIMPPQTTAIHPRRAALSAEAMQSQMQRLKELRGKGQELLSQRPPAEAIEPRHAAGSGPSMALAQQQTAERVPAAAPAASSLLWQQQQQQQQQQLEAQGPGISSTPGLSSAGNLGLLGPQPVQAEVAASACGGTVQPQPALPGTVVSLKRHEGGSAWRAGSASTRTGRSGAAMTNIHVLQQLSQLRQLQQEGAALVASMSVTEEEQSTP